jgi:hypothetical protein
MILLPTEVGAFSMTTLKSLALSEINVSVSENLLASSLKSFLITV